MKLKYHTIAICLLALTNISLSAKHNYKKRFGAKKESVKVVPQKRTVIQKKQSHQHTPPSSRPTEQEYRAYTRQKASRRHAKVDPPRFSIKV